MVSLAGCSVAGRSADADVERIAAAFNWVGFQVIAGWSAQGASGSDVKAAVVKRALDYAVYYEAIGQVCVFVCAEAVGGVVAVPFEPVDCEGAAALVETNDLLFFDVFDGADFQPFARGLNRGVRFNDFGFRVVGNRADYAIVGVTGGLFD